MRIHTLADVIQELEKRHLPASPTPDVELAAMNSDEQAKALHGTLLKGLTGILSTQANDEPYTLTPISDGRMINKVGQYLDRHDGTHTRYFFVLNVGLPRLQFQIDVSLYLESAPTRVVDAGVKQLSWTITGANPAAQARIDCGAWPVDTSLSARATIDMAALLCKLALEKVCGN